MAGSFQWAEVRRRVEGSPLIIVSSMAIQMDPTQAEARQLIACLVGYWLLFAVALIGKSGLFLLLMLPAAALLLFFFWIVLRIVARETGRPLAMYLNPLRAIREGQYWRMVRESLAWTWKLMSPHWIGARPDGTFQSQSPYS